MSELRKNLPLKECLGIDSTQEEIVSRDLSDLVVQLREAADPTSLKHDRPWWWDCPERGGVSALLFEAANAIEERINNEIS